MMQPVIPLGLLCPPVIELVLEVSPLEWPEWTVSAGIRFVQTPRESSVEALRFDEIWTSCLPAVFNSPTMKAFLPWRSMTMGGGWFFHAMLRFYWDFWSECVVK